MTMALHRDTRASAPLICGQQRNSIAAQYCSVGNGLSVSGAQASKMIYGAWPKSMVIRTEENVEFLRPNSHTQRK